MKLKQIYESVMKEKQRFAKEKGVKYQPEILKKYHDEFKRRNDPFLFAQFSDVPKLGMNPQSSFRTPLGIYSYSVIDGEQSVEEIEKGDVPFAGDREHIILFTVKPQYKKHVLILDKNGNINPKSGVTEQDLEMKLNELEPRDNPEELEKYFYAIKNAFNPSTLSRFWNVTRIFSVDNFDEYSFDKKPNITKWNKLLRDLGIYGVIDKGSGTVHFHEPHQAVFFSKEMLELLEIIDKKEDNKKPYSTHVDLD
jgi:hypothetical protein